MKSTLATDNKRNLDGTESFWTLWRQDDNGHRFVVSVLQTQEQARQAKHTYERSGHKQYYWIEPCRE